MNFTQLVKATVVVGCLASAASAAAFGWGQGNEPWRGHPFGGRSVSPFGNGQPFGEHGPIFGSMPFNRYNSPFRGGPWDENPFPRNGMFGEYGPDGRGAPPWGRPSRWFTPWDPKEGWGNWWDDGMNSPSRFGRMPPGWEAPTVDVPNPVDVHDEFDRAFRDWEGF